MRSFEHPNMTNFECPVCNTAKDLPVVLIGKEGTEEGNIMQAEQVHEECMLYMYGMHCEPDKQYSAYITPDNLLKFKEFIDE